MRDSLNTFLGLASASSNGLTRLRPTCRNPISGFALNWTDGVVARFCFLAANEVERG